MNRRLVLPALLLALTAAAPDGVRTIDMTAVIIGTDGKPLRDTTKQMPDDPKCDNCGSLTLGSVVAAALLADRKDEPGITSVEKAKRGVLALRLLDDKAATLNATQLADIERLLSIWPPLVVARALPLLDPAVDLSGK